MGATDSDLITKIVLGTVTDKDFQSVTPVFDSMQDIIELSRAVLEDFGFYVNVTENRITIECSAFEIFLRRTGKGSGNYFLTMNHP